MVPASCRLHITHTSNDSFQYWAVTHRALAISLVRSHLPPEMVFSEYLLCAKVPDDVRRWLQCASDYTTNDHPTASLYEAYRLPNQFCPGYCGEEVE